MRIYVASLLQNSAPFLTSRTTLPLRLASLVVADRTKLDAEVDIFRAEGNSGDSFGVGEIVRGAKSRRGIAAATSNITNTQPIATRFAHRRLHRALVNEIRQHEASRSNPRPPQTSRCPILRSCIRRHRHQRKAVQGQKYPSVRSGRQRRGG